MKKLFAIIFLSFLFIGSAYANSCSVVKGTVWHDKNRDGIQNDDIPLVKDGIKVYLYNENGELVKESNVNDDGEYEFSVPCGYYYIKVDKGDYCYYSPKDEGDDDTIDSDVDSSGKSDVFGIASGETKVIDAGLKCGARLKGRVWFDKNANGIEDDNESGVEGVKVYLIKEGEETGIYALTDQNGYYLFDDIACEYNYEVRVVKPNDYDAFTSKNSGTDDTIDSDVDSSGLSDEIVVDKCQEYDNIDAGLVINDDDNNNENNQTKKACIGNFMWLDKDLDGIQDKNEPAVIDVKVYLYDANGNLLKTTKTNKDGYYEFCKLSDGEYRVKFDLPNSYLFTLRDSGDNDKLDSDVDKSGWSHKITIKDGKNDMSVDAGIYCECDDYQVHPQNYKKVSAGVTLEMIFGLLVFVLIATSSLKLNKD